MLCVWCSWVERLMLMFWVLFMARMVVSVTVGSTGFVRSVSGRFE